MSSANWEDQELELNSRTRHCDNALYSSNDGLDNTPLLDQQHETEIPMLGVSLTHGSVGDVHCHWRSKRVSSEAVTQLVTAVILCFIFMICELIGGYIAGSLAIMCDAAHLLSDCAGFMLALLAFYIANKPPDSIMTFGYKRAEVLGAMASVLLIWILTGIFMYVASVRLYRGDITLEPNTMMIVSGVGVIINIVMALVLHGSCSKIAHHHNHAHNGHATFDGPEANSTALVHDTIPGDHHHTRVRMFNGRRRSSDHYHVNGVGANGIYNVKEFTDETDEDAPSAVQQNQRSINLRAALIHVVGDLIQSTGVLAASILVKFFPSAKIVDPICALIFSALVLCTTWGVVKEAFLLLMEASPVSNVNASNCLRSVRGVRSIHSLHIWSLTSSHVVLTAHIVIDDYVESEAVLKECIHIAKNKLGVYQATIQVERYNNTMSECDICHDTNT